MLPFFPVLPFIGELIILGIISIAIMALVTYEHGGAAGVLLAIVLFASFMQNGAIVALFTNPFAILLWFFYYIGIGFAWSLVHWYYYVRTQFEQMLKRQGAHTVNADDFKPKSRREVGRICSWMFFWPWDALWTIINQPIKRFGQWIVRVSGKLYDGIANMVFRSVVK